MWVWNSFKDLNSPSSPDMSFRCWLLLSDPCTYPSIKFHRFSGFPEIKFYFQFICGMNFWSSQSDSIYNLQARIGLEIHGNLFVPCDNGICNFSSRKSIGKCLHKNKICIWKGSSGWKFQIEFPNFLFSECHMSSDLFWITSHPLFHPSLGNQIKWLDVPHRFINF